MRSVRLDKLVSVLPQCDLLADVGCDHGYVGIAALRCGKAKRVAFTDISQPSLNKAQHNCPKQFADRVSFHCCDGLGDISADCAIVAGMGGLEIISILQGAKYLPRKLVVQPMRNQMDVRQYLTQYYEIISDEKFFDVKFYDVIVASRSDNPTKLNELQLEFGKTNLIAPTADFLHYLRKEISKLKNIPIYDVDKHLQQRVATMQQLIDQLFVK